MPQGEVDDTAHEGHAAGEGSGAPAVYLTHAIDPEAIQAVYTAIGRLCGGRGPRLQLG